jgi:hypothetical protein
MNYPQFPVIDLPAEVLALDDKYVVAIARSGDLRYEISEENLATVIRLAASSGRSFSETINAMIAAADREPVS